MQGSKGIVSKMAHIVDLPGHPRLRAKLDQYVSSAKGIIFLVVREGGRDGSAR